MALQLDRQGAVPAGGGLEACPTRRSLAGAAAALVGTFLGILLAYGVFGPISKAMETRIHAEHDYMLCIRTALLSFARGDAPMTAVEFSRRNIEPHERPSFAELEELTRKKAA